MQEQEQTTETLQDKYTPEEINGLIAGVRPKSMDFEQFKIARKLIKRGIKGHLKGKYFFVSSRLVSGEDKEVYKETATYRKEKK